MPTFNSLCKQIKKCEICKPHLPLGPNPVFQAHPDAAILVVGQAPGIRVHNTSIPFNDPSGDRLREWMSVDKETFYNSKQIALVPMGFCYPGTGKSGDLPPRKECAETWRKPLLDKLPNISLTLVIGQYAHAYHLSLEKKKTLTETVKDWKSFAPSVFPLPHPSPRNNIWLRRNPWFEQEIIPALQTEVARVLSNAWVGS